MCENLSVRIFVCAKITNKVTLDTNQQQIKSKQIGFDKQMVDIHFGALRAELCKLFQKKGDRGGYIYIFLFFLAFFDQFSV